MECVIRKWRMSDAGDLAGLLNNKKILDNLRDGLPFPYTVKDAEEFIAAVVNEQNEIALLRQNYVSATKYVCVAGVMKIGESAEETVVREIKEEIGLDVESVQYIKSYPYEKKEMLMLGYKAVVKKGDFQLSREVDSAAWVKFEDALALLREGSIAWELVKAILI